ncbi:hypothetical protein ACQUJV_03815 [Ralstonia pseudosolanacearum]
MERYLAKDCVLAPRHLTDAVADRAQSLRQYAVKFTHDMLGIENEVCLRAAKKGKERRNELAPDATLSFT